MMTTPPEVTRQKEQLARFLARQETEGFKEPPVRLSTYLQLHQQRRLWWLRGNCAGRILEVGCSWGYVLALCKGHVGVDENPDTIALASILSPDKEFHVANATALPFQDAEFDTVMLPEVLEHMPWEEVSLALSEAARCARRWLLVTMPDGEHETQDAINIKHAWLCTTQKLAEILLTLDKLGFVTRTQRQAGFWLIEANRSR